VSAPPTRRRPPQPILIDSGNGFHLNYQGDHCDANSKAWVNVLKHLAELFNTDAVKVDTTVGNASHLAAARNLELQGSEHTGASPSPV
jgi:hypothetical protein